VNARKPGCVNFIVVVLLNKIDVATRFAVESGVKSEVRIGISGWNYAGWRGRVLSKGMATLDANWNSPPAQFNFH
jgi:hypothetical protein